MTGLTASQGLCWPHPARCQRLRPRHPVQSCRLVDDDTEAQSLVQAHVTVEGTRHRSNPGSVSPELGLRDAERGPLSLLPLPQLLVHLPEEGKAERSAGRPGARACRGVQAQAGSAASAAPPFLFSGFRTRHILPRVRFPPASLLASSVRRPRRPPVLAVPHTQGTCRWGSRCRPAAPCRRTGG